MVSEFVTSSQHRIRYNKMGPSRAPYCELSRLDTRRDSEFRPHRRITPFVRVATLGIELVLQGGSISERRGDNPS